MRTLCAFILFTFGRHVETKSLITMISAPQLCRNRLEDVTNLSNTILLPTVVQMYEFHGKSEKLKKKKL